MWSTGVKTQINHLQTFKLKQLKKVCKIIHSKKSENYGTLWNFCGFLKFFEFKQIKLKECIPKVINIVQPIHYIRKGSNWEDSSKQK